MKRVDGLTFLHDPQIIIVCNQTDTAPVWGFILRQQGLNVIIETSAEKVFDHWHTEITDLVVVDIDASHTDPLELCKRFKGISDVPILLFFPTYNEAQILEAYALGVDDVIVKPISPAIFLAKIKAWVRRGWAVNIEGLYSIKAGEYSLDPAHRCLITPQGLEIKLTNLEFRLLHSLMSRPAHVFSAEDIIQSIWGTFGNGDQVLLKNVVYRLRKKIEADPSKPVLLQTWQGGYSFHGQCGGDLSQ